MTDYQEQLRDVFCRVMAIKAETIQPETSRDQLSYWKSLKHINLIVEVEKALGIKIPSAEAIAIDSYNRLSEVAAAKLGVPVATKRAAAQAQEMSPPLVAKSTTSNQASPTVASDVPAATKKRGFFAKLFG